MRPEPKLGQVRKASDSLQSSVDSPVVAGTAEVREGGVAMTVFRNKALLAGGE